MISSSNWAFFIVFAHFSGFERRIQKGQKRPLKTYTFVDIETLTSIFTSHKKRYFLQILMVGLELWYAFIN